MLFRSAEQGVWKWTTGPETGNVLTYTNWNLGEPNNGGMTGLGAQDYLMVYSSSNLPTLNGRWDDIWGDKIATLPTLTNGYVVEYGGLAPTYEIEIRDRAGTVLEEIPLKPATLMLVPPKSVTGPAKASASVRLTQAPAGEVVSGQQPLDLPAYPLESDPEQVLDPRVAYVTTHLMTEVVKYGTGVEARELGRPAAGKTGTTNDYLDAWFTGFTPDVVTVAWVGHDTQTPLGSGETGARAALPIWLSFMKEAVKQYPDSEFPAPTGIVFASIDPNTGRRLEANASRGIREAFIEGTEPRALPSGTAAQPESAGDFLKEDFQ